jgi:hypothetical protein
VWVMKKRNGYFVEIPDRKFYNGKYHNSTWFKVSR